MMEFPRGDGVPPEPAADDDQATLLIEAVRHVYPGRTALCDVSLSVRKGEVMALVGPSGCGKSTLAEIAVGVKELQYGRVIRQYRRHAMVFQEPRLLPWLTARSNIAYPLSNLGKKEKHRSVDDAARIAALDDADLDKYPSELSGGMRQRVVIARALAIKPDFVYFDEPFTALDAALKRRMQDLVIEAAARAHFSALFITHDLMEAVRIADRIAVMESKGNGILGVREAPGRPGERKEEDVFAIAHEFLTKDPLFRYINDVDERAVS